MNLKKITTINKTSKLPELFIKFPKYLGKVCIQVAIDKWPPIRLGNNNRNYNYLRREVMWWTPVRWFADKIDLKIIKIVVVSNKFKKYSTNPLSTKNITYVVQQKMLSGTMIWILRWRWFCEKKPLYLYYVDNKLIIDTNRLTWNTTNWLNFPIFPNIFQFSFSFINKSNSIELSNFSNVNVTHIVFKRWFAFCSPFFFTTK